jgi:hypothetical protein
VYARGGIYDLRGITKIMKEEQKNSEGPNEESTKRIQKKKSTEIRKGCKRKRGAGKRRVTGGERM